MLNIKRLIDLARLETGSYKEVAKRLDTSGVRITHWKNGRNEPTPFEIFRMAEIARLEPEKAFYEVMTEVDKDNAEYWCARLESNQRPSASEVAGLQIMLTFLYNVVIQLKTKSLHIARNQGEHISLCYQYHHAPINP